MFTKTAQSFMEKFAIDSSEWSHHLKENKAFRADFMRLAQTDYTEDQLLDLMEKHKINTSKWRKARSSAAQGAGRSARGSFGLQAKVLGRSLAGGAVQGALFGSVTPGMFTIPLQRNLKKNWRALDKDTKKDILEKYKARNYTALANQVGIDAYKGAATAGALTGATTMLGLGTAYLYSPRFRAHIANNLRKSLGRSPYTTQEMKAIFGAPVVAGAGGAYATTKKYQDDDLFQEREAS